jgi:HEAT repeat protein
MALLEIGPRGLPALEMLVTNDDPRMRATALDVMGLVGSAAQTPFPAGCLCDDEPIVRRAAATALGRLADREAAESLRRTLIDPSAAVRAAAATALGRIGDRRVADDLVHLACHDEFLVAHAAAEALMALDPALVTGSARAMSQSRALDEAADLIAIGAV